MLFAPDVEVALISAAALANLGPGDGRLPDVAALDEFVEHYRYSGERTRDDAELRAVRALIPTLRRYWELDDEAALVDYVNELLRAGHALPQLRKHDEWDWHLHAEPPGAGLAQRMLVESAMAMTDVIRAGELDRLKFCADEHCDNVVIDLSKNRSRRFCEAGCGNRANVAAYRARQKQAAGG